MVNQEDELVPKSIENNIILSSFDYSKHKSYMYDQSENNLENGIYTAISYVNKLYYGLHSKCVFNDIDEMQYYHILKLISVVYNFTNDNIETIKLLIIYNANGYPTPEMISKMDIILYYDSHYYFYMETADI